VAYAENLANGREHLPRTPLKDVFIVPRYYLALFRAAKFSDLRGGWLGMGEQQWFYHNADEWNTLAQRLKLTACPFCKAAGTLIRHGSLFGFDDSSPQRKTLRARRIFCSNRNARPGCGRTFSAWCADKIRRLSLTTHAVCQFLQRAAAHGVAAAVRAADCLRSDRTWQRLWKRFDLGQSKIRTALAARCPPPQPPTPPARRPAAAQVLAHLQAAFPDAHCPIAAFQQTLRTFFV
jgi:hypothetical protein